MQHLGTVFALRGGGTTDFWMYARGQWTHRASTPGPVNAGGGLAAVNYGTDNQRDELFALQGGTSAAVWKYEVASDAWTVLTEAPWYATKRPR